MPIIIICLFGVALVVLVDEVVVELLLVEDEVVLELLVEVDWASELIALAVHLVSFEAIKLWKPSWQLRKM